jgi:hypothetical protein
MWSLVEAIGDRYETGCESPAAVVVTEIDHPHYLDRNNFNETDVLPPLRSTG